MLAMRHGEGRLDVRRGFASHAKFYACAMSRAQTHACTHEVTAFKEVKEVNALTGLAVIDDETDYIKYEPRPAPFTSLKAVTKQTIKKVNELGLDSPHVSTS